MRMQFSHYTRKVQGLSEEREKRKAKNKANSAKQEQQWDRVLLVKGLGSEFQETFVACNCVHPRLTAVMFVCLFGCLRVYLVACVFVWLVGWLVGWLAG